MQDASTRALALEKTMEFGISLNEVTDRDMHDDWAMYEWAKWTGDTFLRKRLNRS